MLEPSPTTEIDPEVARARLEDIAASSTGGSPTLVLSFSNTGYRMHAAVHGQVPDWLGDRVGRTVRGTLRGEARRIDVVRTGGRFVDPVRGRPRRLQGRVVAVNPTGNTVTVACPMPVVLKPTGPGQKAGDFEVGQLVACGVKPGVSFAAQGG